MASTVLCHAMVAHTLGRRLGHIRFFQILIGRTEPVMGAKVTTRPSCCSAFRLSTSIP